MRDPSQVRLKTVRQFARFGENMCGFSHIAPDPPAPKFF